MRDNSEIKTFTLQKYKHFTPNGLKKYLNDNFSKKLISIEYIYRGKQKVTYNANDIHHYILAGKLPDYLGKTRLEVVHIPFIEIKLIELTWL